MDLVRLGGFAVNVAMLGVWLWTVRIIIKHPDFPPLVHGALKVSGRGMSVVWVVGLFVAVVAGGPTVASVQQSTLPMDVTLERPSYSLITNLLEDSGQLSSVLVGGRGWYARFGSYGRTQHSWDLRSGESLSYSQVEFRFPLWFPLALVFFWLVIVRVQTREFDKD